MPPATDRTRLVLAFAAAVAVAFAVTVAAVVDRMLSEPWVR